MDMMPLDIMSLIDNPHGGRILHAEMREKMIHPATKKSATQKGYNLQLSQHAPNGYHGAYSLQCFALPGSGKGDRDFNLGDTEEEARKNIKLIVKNL